MQNEKSSKLFGYDFYKSIGNPKYITAPMVDQSELAFRMLTRKYGSQLCFTPMLNSKILIQSEFYFKEQLTTHENDRPLIIQLCGHDPKIMVQAGKLVQSFCNAIDINLGCPQGIAKRGLYGSYLLEKEELVIEILKNMVAELDVPITCKIRIFDNEQRTLSLVKKLEENGCSMLTVHGRTKDQKKQNTGPSNWDIIKKIKESVKIPVICNGSIYTFEDVEKCMAYTGCDGVMSSEAILENPALFSGKVYDLDDLALEYMEMCKTYGCLPRFVKAHLFKILHQGLKMHTNLRDELGKSHKMEDYEKIVLAMKEERKGIKNKLEKFGWYLRYRKNELELTKDENLDNLESECTKKKLLPTAQQNQLLIINSSEFFFFAISHFILELIFHKQQLNMQLYAQVQLFIVCVQLSLISICIKV